LVCGNNPRSRGISKSMTRGAAYGCLELENNMSLRPGTITPLAAIALSLVAGLACAQPQTAGSLATVGTLTCTTDELPPESVADAELSCSFKAPSGEDGNFTGYIARRGMADLPPGKRVLVWTVMAPSDKVGLPALAGTYAGETGGEPAGRLVGGEKKDIVLQPTTGESQIGDARVPTVLQLRLEAVQA
jgi:hypothetical protein